MLLLQSVILAQKQAYFNLEFIMLSEISTEAISILTECNSVNSKG